MIDPLPSVISQSTTVRHALTILFS